MTRSLGWWARGLAVTLCSLSVAALADTVEFPEDELATETVVPVFDKVRSVLNRTVETEKRFELSAAVGMALNEPFYNPLNFQVASTYYLTDMHAANLTFNMFMTGLTSYGEQLQRGEGLTAGQSFDPNEAPAPKWSLLAHYQFTAYYGKISLSKQTVMNLNLFGLLGAGVFQTGGVSNPAVDLGFGQNFYFTPNLAARFDLRLVMYNGPDATSQDLDTGGAKPAEDAFAKEWQFKTYLSLGLSYLF